MKIINWLAAACLCSITTLGGEPQKTLGHSLIVAEYGAGGNRFLEIDPAGKVVWEHKPPGIAVIFQVLPNNNLLYAFSGTNTGVREVNRKGVEVWSYISKSPQVLGCERLANGNTLIGEQGPPAAIEVNAEGERVRSTPLRTSYEHFHQQVRAIHKLPNGNILVSHEGEGAIREFDPEGEIVWEYTGIPMAGEARRLANGNTLIACGTQKRIIEVAPDKRIVWEFGGSDAPELNLTWIFSIQPLSNGNIVAGNFLRGQEGKGAHAFEVTRDKKVVWAWSDHHLVKSITMVRAIDDKH